MDSAIQPAHMAWAGDADGRQHLGHLNTSQVPQDVPPHQTQCGGMSGMGQPQLVLPDRVGHVLDVLGLRLPQYGTDT